MNTQENKLFETAVGSSANHSDSNFDFDRWAVQVRQQMVAALRKRGVR